MEEVVITVIVSAITSYLVTKKITIHYFSVIDGYVKKLLEDIRKAIRCCNNKKC